MFNLLNYLCTYIKHWNQGGECYFFTLKIKCNKIQIDLNFTTSSFPSEFPDVQRSKKKQKWTEKQRNRWDRGGLDNSHQKWALSHQMLKWHCSDKAQSVLGTVVRPSWFSFSRFLRHFYPFLHPFPALSPFPLSYLRNPQTSPSQWEPSLGQVVPPRQTKTPAQDVFTHLFYKLSFSFWTSIGEGTI